jgi:GntR family transcriptional repressor for pyruvate dehydrogenase complex
MDRTLNQADALSKPIETISRDTTADKVLETIRGWILTGQYKPGDTLPSQDGLAQQLNVSRNTLREAIFKLSAMGLVRSKQGVGTVVQPTTPSNYIGSLPDHLLLSDSTLREFIEARIFTERTIVRLVVGKASAEDLAGLEQILELQRQAVESGDNGQFNQQDLAFHLEMGRICGNRVIYKLYQTIWDLLRRFTSHSYKVPGNVQLAYEHHVSIYNAIKERDPDRAAELLVKHIRDISNKTIDYLGLEVDAGLVLDSIII